MKTYRKERKILCGKAVNNFHFLQLLTKEFFVEKKYLNQFNKKFLISDTSFCMLTLEEINC